MALAPPPPLVGAGKARPRDGRSPERPMGGGSRRPRRLSNAPSLARRVGRRDPPPLSSPTRGEEARWGDLRVNSRAEGASGASTGHEIILSIKHARPKADRLPERNYGRFCFAVTGEFTTTRLELSGAATSSTIRRSPSKGRR